MASSAQHPSMRWGRHIARTCEHGHRAVCDGKSELASSAQHPSMRWGRRIDRTFEHGYRAVCGGGLFEVVVYVEEQGFVPDSLVENYLWGRGGG